MGGAVAAGEAGTGKKLIATDVQPSERHLIITTEELEMTYRKKTWGTSATSETPTAGGGASAVSARDRRLAMIALLATAMAGGAAEATAQEYIELPRDEEIRLAMSAAPLSVSADADVYVMGEDGFEKAVEGSNGFACMVIRAASDVELLAPHCFSPDAVESVVPAKLAEARLQRAGRSQEEIARALDARFADGTLPLPSGHSYAYMLSKGQKLGAAGRWLPHFMLYMPYATNEDLSVEPGDPMFPFVGPRVGHPHSTMVIVMREFVDPADVVLPR